MPAEAGIQAEAVQSGEPIRLPLLAELSEHVTIAAAFVMPVKADIQGITQSFRRKPESSRVLNARSG